MKLSAIILFLALFSPGCGLFGKKNFEDTDAYKQLMKQQEETEKRLDSIRKQNYQQLSDSSNNSFRKSIDSLKRSTDSLQKKLNESIQNLKNIK